MIWTTLSSKIAWETCSIELNWIYWQTANEGRPRPEEIIGNAKINTKEKW